MPAPKGNTYHYLNKHNRVSGDREPVIITLSAERAKWLHIHLIEQMGVAQYEGPYALGEFLYEFQKELGIAIMAANNSGGTNG